MFAAGWRLLPLFLEKERWTPGGRRLTLSPACWCSALRPGLPSTRWSPLRPRRRLRSSGSEVPRQHQHRDEPHVLRFHGPLSHRPMPFALITGELAGDIRNVTNCCAAALLAEAFTPAAMTI